MKCENCGHVWVAVYPARVTQLECPECGHMIQLVENPAHSDGWYVSWCPDYERERDRRAQQRLRQSGCIACVVAALVSLAGWCVIWAVFFILGALA